jgi:predicted transcriptional regulator
MREHQMLEDEIGISAGDVIAHKVDRKVISATPSTPVHEAIALMQSREISQLPVIVDGKVLGTVREGRIIDLLVHGRVSETMVVEEVMEDPLPVVAEGSGLADVSDLIKGGAPAVLVRYDDGDLDIITKFDLMHSLPAPRRLG